MSDYPDNLVLNNLVLALKTASEQTYACLLADYEELALSNRLTEAAADRLDQIYAEAERDPVLNFLIDELDRVLNNQLGLLSAECVEGYKDQQAWLRERLEQVPFDLDHRQQVQKMLLAAGFYDGPIDGVFGQRSSEAIQRLHMQLQKRLHKEGFYHKDIDGIFGESSMAAVKAYQQSRSLDDSGIPDEKTVQTLLSEGSS